MHVAAVEKIPASYEHIVPERVGNRRHIVVSELSGRGNVRMRAASWASTCRGTSAPARAHQGPGEPGLSVRGGRGLVRAAGPAQPADYVAPFDVLDVVVISERRRGNTMFAEATVKLKIGDEIVHEVAEGSGPVHALDGAFHKALNPHFPMVRDVRLADYKVRILDPDAATGAKTRVLIEAGGRGALEHHRRLAEHHRGQRHRPRRRARAAARPVGRRPDSSRSAAG